MTHEGKASIVDNQHILLEDAPTILNVRKEGDELVWIMFITDQSVETMLGSIDLALQNNRPLNVRFNRDNGEVYEGRAIVDFAGSGGTFEGRVATVVLKGHGLLQGYKIPY